MNEQIRKAFAPLAQFWAGASTMVKRLLIGGVILAVIVALTLSILLNSKDYVVIFEHLSETETSEILASLQDMDVEVKVQDGTIMVPEGVESKVRMQLATAGYPKNGLSYYLMEENSGMLTTDYERKMTYNLMLQERIAASIKTLEGVRDAVVTITVPEDDVFYLQEKEKPSASVILHIKEGGTLSEAQILGIQNLVAKSVLGLQKEDIALTDSLGNDLMENTSTGRSPDYTKISITREIENDIKKKVSAVLLGPYQSKQFRVSVTATVDTDALITEETTYIPSPDGDNTGVVSEETRSDESMTSSQDDGGVAGTSSNSEIPTYGTGGSTGQSSSTSSSENIKYQVSQTKSQFQKSGAKLEKLSIGIAIDKSSFDPGERESVVQLVAYAAGVSPESISVQNFRFYSEDAPTGPTEPEGGINPLILYGGIAAGVLVLGSLIALILITRSRRRKAEEAVMAQAGKLDSDEILDEVFGETAPVEVVKPITPVMDARREEIKQFARANPEIAAQMIKSWLKSEE